MFFSSCKVVYVVVLNKLFEAKKKKRKEILVDELSGLILDR